VDPLDRFRFATKQDSRAFHFYIELMERLYGLVFAAKRMVKVMPL